MGAKKLTATVGAYSSVVGGSVHIHEGKAFAGQVAFLCQSNTLRDKDLQAGMSAVIADALNKYFATKDPR